jgi:predicted PolB exonuclease-like 3'-5' exonuclease
LKHIDVKGNTVETEFYSKSQQIQTEKDGDNFTQSSCSSVLMPAKGAFLATWKALRAGKTLQEIAIELNLLAVEYKSLGV